MRATVTSVVREALRLAATVALLAAVAPASTPRSTAVVRMAAGGATIGVVLTARGVSTMLTLPEDAREAVCGDLYDPSTGAGGFVIQRSGRDLFLKPLRATGASNLFVKTDCATYAFELVVVPARRAMRIVYVELAASAAQPPRSLRSDSDAEAAEGAREPATASDARPRLEVRLASGLIATGRGFFLRCRVTNLGAEPIEIAAVEVTGGVDERRPLHLRIPPNSSETLVLALSRRPSRALSVVLYGTDGAPIVFDAPRRDH